MSQNKNSSYRWIILLLTFLPCFMMSVCQFQATPYAAQLMEKLHMTEQQYATIATAPMLVGVFLSFISGTLGDKIGVKKVVFYGLILTTIGALSRTVAGSYQILLLVTVLMGVAGVIINANNVKLMSSWFSPEQLGIAIGIIVAAGNGGTVLAMAIGTRLGTYSQAFMISGIIFAVLTILWFLFVKENRVEQEAKEEIPKINFGDVFKSKYTWIAAIGAALYMGINMTVSALLSPGLISNGVTERAASITVIIFSIVALIASIIMPGIINKLPNTKITCALLAILTGIFLNLVWHTSSNGMRNVFIALCGVCAGGLLPTLMSVPATLSEIGPLKMGAAGGLISTVMMAGAFILPSYVITPLAGGINSNTFLIAGVCAVILAVMFVLLPNTSVKENK